MAFDRHEILKRHYAAEVASWNWDRIVAEARTNVEMDPYCDEPIGRCYLGTVFSIMPSGKFYTCWTTNQGRSDETRDAAFIEALEERAADEGGSIESGDDDPCDMFFTMVVEALEDAQEGGAQ